MFGYYGDPETPISIGASNAIDVTTLPLEAKALPTDRESVKAVQKGANDFLSTLGCPPITVDGLFGPQTCGSLRYLQKAYGADTVMVPTNCNTHGSSYSCSKQPKQVVKPTAPGPSPTAPETVLASKGSSGNTGLYVALGVLGVLGLGGLLLATRKGRR